MKSVMLHDPSCTKAGLLRPLLGISCALVLLASVPQIAHAQGCQIGFQSGSTITDANTNGNPANPAAKWADANTIQSGFPCMDFLYDWDGVTQAGGHAVPTLMKSVTVLSKRDASNLYLGFKVLDQTQNRKDPGNVGAQLLIGEKIIIQIDPNHSRGASLGTGPGAAASDYRIELTHKWQNGVFTDQKFKISNVLPINSACGVQDWGDTGTFPVVAGLDTLDIAGGYGVEVKIPLSAIGNPATDIGIAFAVVNDLGFVVSGATDATGVTFPDSLKLQNSGSLVDANDPATCAAAPANWLVPDNWGGGFFNSPPADVTISRLPVWWSSQDIIGFECSVMGYDYFPGTPCKLTLQATLHNSGGSAVVRNILYLFGQHDAGVPKWTFMDLQKGVSVPPGSGPFTSASFNPPAGLANHPCVRVYILPASFRADFTEAMMRSLVNADDSVITDMETKYQLGTQHWAQKNITRRTDIMVCPVAGCNIGMLLPSPSEPSLDSMNLFQFGGVRERGPHATVDPEAEMEAPMQGTTKTTNTTAIPPKREKRPPQIFMSKEELEEFGKQNVIVQVRSFGYVKGPGPKPPAYNLMEGIGGVIQLIPLEMLNKGPVPIQFNVSNPGKKARTIFLVKDILTPSSFGSVTVSIDEGPGDFAPGETKTVNGTVSKGGTNGKNKLAVFFDFGGAFPQGTFANGFDPGFSFNAGLEYMANPHVSVEGIFGAHHFPGKIAGNVNVYQFSANAKVYFTSAGPWRPFVNGGIGGYHFDTGTNSFGGNAGAGLLYEFTPRFGFQASYNFHAVNTSAAATQFSTAQGGVRIVF